MALSTGDTIPDVTLRTMTQDGPAPVASREALGTGTVVLFGVPGAFTPACSDRHLPEYVLRADELRAKGVDTVACVSVNDAFVMDAWGRSREVGDSVVMLADGNGDFTRAVGLELDATGLGLGLRSKRYAAVLRDGVVQDIWVEAVPSDVVVSSADAVLKSL
ncbi:Redoxin domain protein [Pseudonocardia dioxanivorans CB1190]|uniref:Glutathione-dependent peroxiredoxin n=1 Tax=Pseudonocardia dioxanivorans (strain ATCC 55486 / DSM 44775 / JCM 13855 / CB1190) TaxID=675635 RepID=F4CNU1_PSEUX|nr:peroxiredoxin [Pseudonocardia dioxanivorans]AEA22553.1 Redoxin domain protein [Pseudonocardia dioxanivorans CB1190]